MRKSVPFQIIVYAPKTAERKEELKRRVAVVHSDYVKHWIGNCECSAKQKRKLLQKVATNE